MLTPYGWTKQEERVVTDLLQLVGPLNIQLHVSPARPAPVEAALLKAAFHKMAVATMQRASATPEPTPEFTPGVSAGAVIQQELRTLEGEFEQAVKGRAIRPWAAREEFKTIQRHLSEIREFVEKRIR
jgi:hypothetical protein